MPITTCIFDAYGTLFDVAAAARQAAEEPDYPRLQDQWQALSEHWRQKQLQYTWLRAITGQHADFWQVTQEALDWSLEKTALADDPALRARLLALYWELGAYPEVLKTLADLNSSGMKVGILSNGSPEMLQGAVRSAGLEGWINAVLSVQSVGIFKPHHRVYDLVGAHFNCAAREVLFVSSNGWDVAGAAGFGFESVWVNRGNDPVDRLPDIPKHIVPDLSHIPVILNNNR